MVHLKCPHCSNQVLFPTEVVNSFVVFVRDASEHKHIQTLTIKDRGFCGCVGHQGVSE